MGSRSNILWTTPTSRTGAQLMMLRTSITKQTARGQIRTSKLVPITPHAPLQIHSSPREVKPLPSTRNRELIAMARLKDMLEVLILIRRRQIKKILHLAKIKYLFICQDVRGKSAILMNKKEQTNYSLTDPPKHQPMIQAQTAATPTSKTQTWLKICAHHSSPEHQRVSSLTQMFSTTRSEATCIHLPGRQHNISMFMFTLISAITIMTFQAIRLRPPAPKRRDTATRRNDSSSTKKSKRWRRLKCAETSSCIKIANMGTHAAMLTT